MSAPQSPSRLYTFRAGSLASHMRLQEAARLQTQELQEVTALQPCPSNVRPLHARPFQAGAEHPAKGLIKVKAQQLSPSKPGRFLAGSLTSYMRLQDAARAQAQTANNRSENDSLAGEPWTVSVETFTTPVAGDKKIPDLSSSPRSTDSLPALCRVSANVDSVTTPEMPLKNGSKDNFHASYNSQDLFDVSIKRPGHYQDLAKAYFDPERDDLLLDRDVNEALDFRVTRAASLSFDRDAFELIIERSQRRSFLKRPMRQQNTKLHLPCVDRAAIHSMLEDDPEIHFKSIVEVSEMGGLQQEITDMSGDGHVQKENARGSQLGEISVGQRNEMKEGILNRYKLFKEVVHKVQSDICIHPSRDSQYYTTPKSIAQGSKSNEVPTHIPAVNSIHNGAAAALRHEKVIVRDFADFDGSANALTPLLLPSNSSSAEPTPSRYSSSTASLYSEINTSSLVEYNDKPTHRASSYSPPAYYTVSDNGSDAPSALENEEDYCGNEIVTELDQEALAELDPPLRQVMVEIQEQRLELLRQRSLSKARVQADLHGGIAQDDSSYQEMPVGTTPPISNFSMSSVQLRTAFLSRRSSTESPLANLGDQMDRYTLGYATVRNEDASGFSLSHYQSFEGSSNGDMTIGSITVPGNQRDDKPVGSSTEPAGRDLAVTHRSLLRGHRPAPMYGIDSNVREYFSHQGLDISTPEAARLTFAESGEDSSVTDEPTIGVLPQRDANALRNAFAADRGQSPERNTLPATPSSVLDINPEDDPLLQVHNAPLPTIETVAGLKDSPSQSANLTQMLASSSPASDACQTALSWWNALPGDPNRGSLYLKGVAERERKREEYLRDQGAESIKAGVVNEQAGKADEAESLANLVRNMNPAEYEELLAQGVIWERLLSPLSYPERRILQETINKVRRVKLGYAPIPMTEQWLANNRFKRARKVIESTREKGVFYNDAARMKQDKEEAVAQGATWPEDPEVNEVIRRFEVGEITRGAPGALPTLINKRPEAVDDLERADGITVPVAVEETGETGDNGNGGAIRQSGLAPAATRRKRGLSLFSRLFGRD